MKKIILSLVAVLAYMNTNAQIVEVYMNGTLQATYTNTSTDKYKVVFEEAPDPNLLPGSFSVSDKKQVQFTKSNVYWDGSAYKFEANQTDYQPLWNASHVDHFSWSKTASVSCAETYSDASAAITDALFCSEATPLTVEGTNQLYVLTLTEWQYLINSRTSSLYKLGVTVTNDGTSYTNCLIIAPDNFSGTLASSYTLEEVNNLGLVCLPASGSCIDGTTISGGSWGYYWLASPHATDADKALNLAFNGTSVRTVDQSARYCGFCMRLVRGL